MVWILLLWAGSGGEGDERTRLAEAVRETRPEEAREALAELSANDGVRAAKAVFAYLPRARDRMAALCAATVQARLDHARIETDFTFSIFEDRLKQRRLEEAQERIREVSRLAVDAERVYDTLREAIPALGPEGIEVLAEEAGRTRSWLLKCELLEGMAAAGAREPLRRALDREKEPVVLAAALPGVASVRAADFLAHPQWQVRIAALQGLRGTDGAVEGIIGRLDRLDRRFHLEAGAVLRDLTGTDLPADPAIWRDWWKANGEDFRAGRYSPLRVKSRPGPGRTTFYEIPIVSDRVCFVIDRSASMRVHGRFGTAKKELKRLLDEMPDGASVNIIFFGESTACFARSMRVLDRSTRREAETFIDRQFYDRGTDLYRALEKALALVGSAETGKLRENGPDTIVVLSDGQATVGRLVDDELVGRVVARRARYLRPVIHAISLTSDAPSMKILAGLTGGEYRMQ